VAAENLEEGGGEGQDREERKMEKQGDAYRVLPRETRIGGA